MVKKGAFREDLLYRLRTVVIELPPLREMKEDIKELVLSYLAKFCEQYDVPMKGFSPEFLDVLIAYNWPGNVRELIQALEKAVVIAKEEPVLFPKHLPEHIRVHLARASVLRKRPSAESSGEAAEVSRRTSARPGWPRWRRSISRPWYKGLAAISRKPAGFPACRGPDSTRFSRSTTFPPRPRPVRVGRGSCPSWRGESLAGWNMGPFGGSPRVLPPRRIWAVAPGYAVPPLGLARFLIRGSVSEPVNG